MSRLIGDGSGRPIEAGDTAMAIMIHDRANGIRGLIEHGRYAAKRSRSEIALSHLVDELVIAFFVAMAVMWVVTTIAGIFG